MDDVKKLCIYHAGCVDGFGAAVAFYAVYGDGPDTRYRAAQYGDAPPVELIDENTDVYILDFSYPKQTLQQLATHAHTITVIDHHKTAQEDLSDDNAFVGLHDSVPMCDVYVHFDMQRSGAMMAWEYFLPLIGTELPRIVKHIQDYDLWRFRFTESKAVWEALSVMPHELKRWYDLFYDEEAFQPLVYRGEELLLPKRKRIDYTKKMAARVMFDGHLVNVVNCPGDLINDVVGELAEGDAFAVGYFDTNDKRVYSLRSRVGGLDVSQICKRRGGGGHRNAAGFATAKPPLFI